MSNLSAIDRLLAREETVSVHGEELTLRLPDAAKLKEIRALTARIAQLGEDSEDAVTLATDLSVTVLAACLSVPEDQAILALTASGGDMGELAAKARELVGLGVPEEAEDGEVDFPS